MSVDLLEDETWDELTGRFVELARDSGALATLPMALTLRIVMEIFAGDLAGAASLLQELGAATEGTGIQAPPYAAQLLAAWQGREDGVAELIATTTADVERRGEGLGPIAAGWMKALLCNSRGRYREALTAAQQAIGPPQEMGVLTWSSLAELITAAARAGRPAVATDALQRLADFTQASGTDWALGLEACCRGLVSEARPPTAATSTRSITCPARASAVNSPARICTTANGCDGRTAAASRATSSAPRTRCSPPCAWTVSPNLPHTNLLQQVKPSASAVSKCRASSHRRRRKSPGWSGTGCRTRRSPPGYSSARAPSNGT